MILLTTITSTNGTLQLFDESLNLTNGGPGKSTMTMSHYIYNMSFVQSPNFGYAAGNVDPDPDYGCHSGTDSDESR